MKFRIPGWPKSGGTDGILQKRIARVVGEQAESPAVFNSTLLDRIHANGYYAYAQKDGTMRSLLTELERLEDVRTSDSRTYDDRREADLQSRIARRYRELGGK